MVTTTKYVWDPVFDCVTHELDENNAVKAVYHNEPQQYGGVLSQRRGNTSHYHHHDAMGSTRFLTDSSGTVTDTYLNDAWGNSVASTGTTVNPFRWVGKYGYYTDNSTGQVYVRARMYQPAVARWVSVDPLFESGELYNYGNGNATRAIDPSGLLTVAEKKFEISECGRYLWEVEWSLQPDEQTGVILQRVCVTHNVVECDGANCQLNEPVLTNCPNQASPTACQNNCYWEAWGVNNGAVVGVGEAPAALNLVDSFAWSGCKNPRAKGCTRGQHYKSGEGMFLSSSDLLEPVVRKFLRHFSSGQGGVPQACGLTSTCDPQPGSVNSSVTEDKLAFIRWHYDNPLRKTVFRILNLAWDCCEVGCPVCKSTGGVTMSQHVIF
jgi:RHS repeat-associated protein